MKKTFLVIIGFVCLTVSVAFTTFNPPRFKNLKILPKDISKESLDSVMHLYSHSLNVKCDFCHVHIEGTKTWDMASDAKPEKLITRKMMIMAAAINKNYFPPEKDSKDQQAIQTITCYTCHKGEARPVSVQEQKEQEK